MATAKKTTELIIPALQIKTVDLHIVGDSPLICHAWSEKAKLMMLGKQQKKATSAKEVRRPAVEFADSLYWLTEKPNLDNVSDEDAQAILNEVIPKSKFGFPSLAFKSAAIDGAFQQKALDKKTTARGAIHIVGEFAEINGIPTLREDMARIGMGTADLRFRAEFKTWSTVLHIKFNSGAISLAQVVNLFRIGGFSNGVGDWRPAKDGTFGTFHIETAG